MHQFLTELVPLIPQQKKESFTDMNKCLEEEKLNQVKIEEREKELLNKNKKQCSINKITYFTKYVQKSTTKSISNLESPNNILFSTYNLLKLTSFIHKLRKNSIISSGLSKFISYQKDIKYPNSTESTQHFGTKINEKYSSGLLSAISIKINSIQKHKEILFLFQHELDWQLFSNLFFNKNISFLQFQFKNILKQKHRISWSEDEDKLLIKATEEEGSGCWNEISKNLYFSTEGKIFKSPKHCRERWLNHLDRTKNKGKWTDEEDFLMLTFIKENGKKWSRISQLLNHTRTEHMVKNRFNSLMTKIRKNKKEKEEETIKKVLLLLEEKKEKQSTNQREVKEKHENKRTSLNYSSDDQEIEENYDENEQQYEHRSSKNSINEQNSQQKNNKLQIENGEYPKEEKNGINFCKVKKYQELPNIEPNKNESFFSKEDALKSNPMNVGFYNFFVELPTTTIGESSIRPGMVFFYHMPWLGSDKMNYYPIQSIEHQQESSLESQFSLNLSSQLYKTQPVHIIQHNRK